MHDNGKQFTSRIFRHFLVHNQLKDKLIPNSYPQIQGKIEAYNKIVKSEFPALEDDIPSIDDGKQIYDMFVKAYNGLTIRDVSTKINYTQYTYKN